MNDNRSLVELEETKKLCQLLTQTPHYKKIGAEGIYAIVQKAKSVGVDPLDALNGSFYYVQGKVEMTAGMMNDLIRRQGHSITKDKKSDEKICILHGRRKDNGDTWSESFSIEDAQTAGIYRNQWLKYPKDMLFARALSRLARQLFPDVIKGCYVENEISSTQIKPLPEDVSSEIEPEISLEEAKAMVLSNISVEEEEFLEEYLGFVKERVQKPLKEVIDSWILNPEPFKNHYGKWCVKKMIDANPSIAYKEEREAALFEDQA